MNNQPETKKILKTAFENQPITKYINAKCLLDRELHTEHILANVCLYKAGKLNNSVMTLSIIPADGLSKLSTIKAFYDLAQVNGLRLETMESKPTYQRIESNFYGEGKEFNLKNMLASHNKICKLLMLQALSGSPEERNLLTEVKENLVKSLRELGYKGELW